MNPIENKKYSLSVCIFEERVHSFGQNFKCLPLNNGEKTVLWSEEVFI